MPNLEWHKTVWGKDNKWLEVRAGEKWSQAWGGSLNQWLTTIYPRIYRFIPATTLMEIAPGYGRWTQYLIKFTKNHFLVLIYQKHALTSADKILNLMIPILFVTIQRI